MQATIFIQDRKTSEKDIAFVRRLIKESPGLHRKGLFNSTGIASSRGLRTQITNRKFGISDFQNGSNMVVPGSFHPHRGLSEKVYIMGLVTSNSKLNLPGLQRN